MNTEAKVEFVAKVIAELLNETLNDIYNSEVQLITVAVIPKGDGDHMLHEISSITNQDVLNEIYRKMIVE